MYPLTVIGNFLDPLGLLGPMLDPGTQQQYEMYDISERWNSRALLSYYLILAYYSALDLEITDLQLSESNCFTGIAYILSSEDCYINDELWLRAHSTAIGR